MNSVVSASRSRTSSARRKAQTNTDAPKPERASAQSNLERAQLQRSDAKKEALAKLVKHKPVEKPE